jgi:hypothetical protein
MKKIFLILLFAFLFAFSVDASTGFIPGQIWYSSEEFKEGKTINIYTVVWNGEEKTIDMKVDFYDSNTLLGTRDISISPNSTKQVSISWRITSGSHTIFAKITSSAIEGSNTSVSLKNSETDRDSFFVPVTIVTSSGDEVTSGDIIENQIDKASAKIIDSVPSSVSEPVLNIFSSVEEFRENSSSKINEAKENSKKNIEIFKQENSNNTENKEASLQDVNKKDGDVEKEENNNKLNLNKDSVKKPLEYVKFFLFSFISFIFSNKIVFYLLIIFLIFLIARFIYRKIRKQ